ncbi:hypothetical protein LTR22_015829 [Elasticomyces elasticus]|nr:hypothetical protein LTR22_015829 [Elasticomyces elasticus]KAK4914827.1 hypothetical protein LTR49_016939 [Elasticomyces elasticus]KAK5754099.1 hypothetical protein LTS12_015853 [Elasticomyces elasticus]
MTDCPALMPLGDLPDEWSEICMSYVRTLYGLPITRDALFQIWYGSSTWDTAMEMAKWDWAGFFVTDERDLVNTIPDEVKRAVSLWVTEWQIPRTVCGANVVEKLRASITPSAMAECIVLDVVKPALRQLAISCFEHRWGADDKAYERVMTKFPSVDTRHVVETHHAIADWAECAVFGNVLLTGEGEVEAEARLTGDSLSYSTSTVPLSKCCGSTSRKWIGNILPANILPFTYSGPYQERIMSFPQLPDSTAALASSDFLTPLSPSARLGLIPIGLPTFNISTNSRAQSNMDLDHARAIIKHAEELEHLASTGRPDAMTNQQ